MLDTTLPEPPNGQGEVLEWSASSYRRTVGILAAVTVALVGLRYFGQIGEVGLQNDRIHWWMYVLYLGLAGTSVHYFGHPVLSAGATWVQQGRNWVDTHDLVRVTVGYRGRRRRVLHFEDGSGRRIRSYPYGEARAHQKMWALVHDGILHSVGSGRCDISSEARRLLDIPRDVVANEKSIRRTNVEFVWTGLLMVFLGGFAVFLGVQSSRILPILGGAAVVVVFGWLTYRVTRRM
nr:hypothetical protein [Rhodococcus sp. (in: high G+C Gram-positive bacteria)]